jgi:hypothetical protein
MPLRFPFLLFYEKPLSVGMVSRACRGEGVEGRAEGLALPDEIDLTPSLTCLADLRLMQVPFDQGYTESREANEGR